MIEKKKCPISFLSRFGIEAMSVLINADIEGDSYSLIGCDTKWGDDSSKWGNRKSESSRRERRARSAAVGGSSTSVSTKKVVSWPAH